MVFLLLSDRPFLRCYANRTGDGADTKDEMVNDPTGDGGDDGTSASRDVGDHDSTAYATFFPFNLGCN